MERQAKIQSNETKSILILVYIKGTNYLNNKLDAKHTSR